MKQDSTQIQEPEKKHSPLPWRILESKVPGYERHISVVHGEETNLSICQLSGAGSLNPQVLVRARADADLIARAVNNHDALVEALKEMVGVEYRHGSPAKRDVEYLAAVEKARTALAAAKE